MKYPLLRRIFVLSCLFFFGYANALTEKSTDSLFTKINSAASPEDKAGAALDAFYYLNVYERDSSAMDSLVRIVQKLKPEIKNDTLYASLLFLEANYYYMNRKLELCISIFDSSATLFEKLKMKEAVARCYNILASTYVLKNLSRTAAEYLYRNIYLFNEIHDTAGLVETYAGTGRIYLYSDEPVRSNEAWNKILMLNKGNNRYCYAYKAENFLKLHQLDSAKKCLAAADSMALSNVVFEPPYFFRAMGYYYKYISAWDSSSFYFIKAIHGFEKAVQKHHIPLCYAQLGEIALEQKNNAKAESYFTEALKYSKQFDRYPAMLLAYTGLSKVYEKQNQKAKGFEALKNAMIVRDSLKKFEAKDFLVAQEFQFQIKEKEEAMKREGLKKELEKQVLLKEKKQARIISIGIILFILSFAIVFLLQRNKISGEKKRSDELLLNILPEETAEELKETGQAQAKQFDEVTVMFTDFKNFTYTSEQLSATELVKEIHHCYSEFDKIITRHGLEKIKTIGDSYMCAGGLPVPNKSCPENTIKAALEIRDFMKQQKLKRDAENKPFFEIRIGCNTGPVVAGIVGIKKFAYDIWGDTVNIAARMEQNSEAGKINISGTTYQLVKDKFNCEHRGKISAKNKGEIDMYFVEA